MAGLTDPAFWQRQLDAFTAAPVPFVIALALGAGGAWWLRGTVVQGEVTGLRERNAVLEERLRLGAEKVQQRDEALEKLRADLARLEEAAKSSKASKEFVDASVAALANVNRVINYDTDLSRSLGFGSLGELPEAVIPEGGLLGSIGWTESRKK